ncbi:sesquipedalian-1 [Anopheles stephensi]|uniref:sesquipedalian-1 n=1 Tax=Anopheles stephensi TaxID=30069 RepID=UPI0007D45C67|nr:sesquipedalian-1 [Anopheles stephensi]XP_035903790.1 sesquipedalian-1 [Anopheles stephensi]XP_035903800.1 sesquipedalian-1 [Anopheles stephensi]
MKINEKNLCTFATTPPVDLEGWMNKRGESNKSWQRRWFVLKGNLLFYFDKRTDKEPLGMIILEGCTVELAEESEQYCFQIIFHGPNNRSYYLSTESQTNMEQWMKALTCAGYDYMKLMVAELQRQLDEIEGQCREKTPETTPMLAPPKAPPRRHNPFNKPLTTEYASNADTTRVPDDGTGTSPPTRTGRKVPAASSTTPSPSKPDRPEAIPNRTAGKQTVTGTKSSDAIATMATTGGAPLERGAVVSFSFETMHSALGVPVLADLSKWNASRQELAQTSNGTDRTEPEDDAKQKEEIQLNEKRPVPEESNTGLAALE